MKPDPIIPSIKDQQDHAKEQREQFLKREKLQPMFLNANGKSRATPFKRGDKLSSEYSFAPGMGDWSPAGKAELVKLVDPKLLKRLEDEWQAEGLAGFIATTDTTAGVSELIEYEPDEQFVRSRLEPTND